MSLGVGEWTKSSQSFSNGNCVDVGVWNKSPQSIGNGNGQCVETTGNGHAVLVRDTKVSDIVGDKAPTQEYALVDWDKLQNDHQTIAEAADASAPYVRELSDGSTFVQAPTRDGGLDWIKVENGNPPAVPHEFTREEIGAWAVGAAVGEFKLAPELQPELDAQRQALTAA